MKRAREESAPSQAPLEDAGDRAQKRRKAGNVRISLDEIGFWPENRGGVGLSSYHAHEVAWDCKSNKTKLTRYGHVDLVEIPKELLEQIRNFNRDRCESDSMMPNFARNMVYVCASKTHFAHAHKLKKDGGRTLFDEGRESITWQEDDTEGNLIETLGPVCAIYDSSLFYDKAAMQALSSEDNLNASVQWAEDEMQAFGRVHLLMESQARSQEEQKVAAPKLIDLLQVSGLGKFSVHDWNHFIALRAALPAAMAKVFTTCQFHICAGRVSVKAQDFGITATLDPRWPWPMVCIMLWQYIGSLDLNTKKVPTSGTPFQGRREKWAKKLQKEVVSELANEPQFLCSVEEFVKAMLQTYSKPSGGLQPQQELLLIRGEFLANCGRFLLKVANALYQAGAKAAMRKATLTPGQRSTIVEQECVNTFARAEEFLRKKLLLKNLYAEGSLPQPLYEFAGRGATPAVAPSQATSIEVCLESHDAVSAAGSDTASGESQLCVLTQAGVLTAAHVFSRLGVKGCGESVLAFTGPSGPLPEHTGVKIEACNEGSELAEVGQAGLPPDAGAWVQARLISVTVPAAVVEVPGSEGSNRITVSVDALRPYRPVKTKTVIPHPTQQEPGHICCAYDYDKCDVSAARACAESMIFWAHWSSLSCVERVRVSRLSDEDKFPLTLQVRALEAFKKGTLVLAPAYGYLIEACNGGDVALSQGLLHRAMLSKLALSVSATVRDKRCKPKVNQSDRKTAFEIRSPLLAARKHTKFADLLENIPPFWALLRGASPKQPHNMELENTPFTDSGFDVKGVQFPKVAKGFELIIDMPIARNCCNIEKDEILCLPFGFE